MRKPPANTTEEKVVLVNEQDEAIGVEDKTRAHLLGALHRAFSVFVVNSRGPTAVTEKSVDEIPFAGTLVEHLLRSSSPRRIHQTGFATETQGGNGIRLRI